ncbi:MAG: tRNA (N6-isopentenyl adenosine(37)-C2)-methylthiotransferase MiaB [Deltaproteobacteria bacterium]|nr:tRNA (N6-isopentenyl adenosine(37)-C2)-methylthiotransferase MiaB [Deltaproteobacteria bacterium]
MVWPKRKLYIRTFGCQMNVADSELMAQVLGEDFDLTVRAEDADLYLINTCAIRRKSEEKVKSLLGSLKPLKQAHPQLILAVGGCVAQQEGERLLAFAPHLNLVFGTKGIYRLPELVDRAARGERVVDVALERDLPDSPHRSWPPGTVQTMVTIMRGCDNFCSFCVVPYVRGRETSREPGAIVDEVAAFVAAGGLEVTLLGQNVNSYGRGLPEPITFPQLLQRLNGLPGLNRLRFATSHPRDLSPELINAFGELHALCEHLHLPVQSGANRILARMNRGYTREHYREKVASLKGACPGIALSTDLIVGFPGETEADFIQTLDLMREAGFDQAFSFKYSPRPQTRAATFPDQVPEDVKAERLARLQALQDELTQKAHARLVGREQEVLVEGRSKRSPQELCGRLRTNQIVNFIGPRELVGDLARVAITEAHPHSLKGRWVEGSATA